MVWFRNTLGLGISLPSQMVGQRITQLLGISVVGLVLSGCQPTVNTKASTAASGGSGSSTVTDLGTLDPAVAWLGAGNYSDVDLTTLPANKVCSDKSIFGTTGTAVCVAAPATLDMTQSFLSGNYDAISNAPATNTYRSSVSLFGVAGTMAEPASHSSANTTSNSTTVTLTPQLGYWDGVRTVAITDAALIVTNICSGKTIFGRAGAAVCNSIFGDLTGSGAHRDIATTQVALSSEVNHGTCSDNTYTTRKTCESNSATWTATALPAGYRARPLVNKDHDGFNPAGGGNDPSSNPNPSNQITKADTSGIVSCGTTQPTIEGRIADCAYSWDGATQGNSAQGKWTLVTKTAGNYEVWRDERTQLIWGDNMGTNNWCQAAGNTENSGDDNQGWTVDCTPGAGSGLQPNPAVSMCAESAGLNSDGYDDQKGGMRLTATGTSPSVAWRLPTRDDMLQAYANGAGYVMSYFRDGNAYWTASVYSGYRNDAWVFSAGDDGGMVLYGDGRGNSVGYSVRCVGR